MKVIDSFSGEYRWLSNFWMCPVVYDGFTFQSSEQVYQYAKCELESDKLLLKRTTNPAETKKLGRRVKIRADWEEVKVKLMYEIVEAKFKQNPELAQKLKETGNVELIEGNWWGDTFWGVCKGVGVNNLGKILMDIRREL